jgi:hypothetical protein
MICCGVQGETENEDDNYLSLGDYNFDEISSVGIHLFTYVDLQKHVSSTSNVC